MVEAWKNKGRRVMLRTLLMGYAGLRKYGGVNLGRVLLHVRKITQVSGWKRLKGRSQLPYRAPSTVDPSIRIGIQHHNLSLFLAN